VTSAACTVSLEELLSYWLRELAAAEELRLDEHLIACASCAERLGALVELGAAIRREASGGEVGFVASASLIDRLREKGLHVREYTLDPGGRVSCTVTPEDDLVVSHLRAPLRGVHRLDVVIDDSTSGTRRVSDVAFDPGAGSVMVVPSVKYLRTLGSVRQRVRLVAVEGLEERVIADYTFDHSPS
jgi:hypothetical protein